MLTIRADQLQILAEDCQRRFEKKLVAFLHRQTKIPEERLQRELPAALEAARRLGLRSESDIARYCEVMYATVGDASWNATPKAARNILFRHDAQPDEKITRFEQWMRGYAIAQQELNDARR